MTNEEKIARCIRCRTEFTARDLEGAAACPHCGSTSVPMSPKDDLSIKINWHELRVLSIWAENWANLHKENYPELIEDLWAIVAPLQDQFPDKTPLTFSGEIGDLRRRFPEQKINISGPFTEGAPLPEEWDDVIE